MTDFRCSELGDSTVMMMFLEKDKIFLDPPYQRSGDIWNLYKKQLLIDSLINGFDIPKLYLHEYEKAQRQKAAPAPRDSAPPSQKGKDTKK